MASGVAIARRGTVNRERRAIHLMEPHVPPAAVESVAKTLHSRWIGQGPKVDEFERRFSQQLVAGRECVAVGSCTDALHLAYLLAGIKEGDEVIAPLFTCTATNMPLLWEGAEIRFADIAPGSLNVDTKHVRRLMTERTKAIVAVHYGGAVAELEDLWSLGVPVIEDCAQALGAKYQGLPVGTYSAFSCFSFQAVKHVTTGDGGMLVLDGPQAEKARRMRWFGIDRKAKLGKVWANDITEVGYKYQMTDIAAAMGLAGLDGLDQQLNWRWILMNAYRSGIDAIPGISLMKYAEDDALWLCTAFVDSRSGLQKKLAEHDIESDPVHYRNDRYEIFAKYRKPGDFPNMDAVEDCYLCLPLHMGMTVEDVDSVCDVIRSGW